MKVLILGSGGSMGRRYASILSYLSVPFTASDICGPDASSCPLVEEYTHAIIATPTNTHCDVIRSIVDDGFRGNVLCEKPITKDMDELLAVIQYCKDHNVDLRMVMQYTRLNFNPTKRGDTAYNFYNHGKDGLAWDCIQIIGLATQNPVLLGETSPIWACMINSQHIDLRQMDKAYVTYVSDWLRARESACGEPEILFTHKRVHEWLASQK